MSQPHVALTNVSRVYPGTRNQGPVHALGPLDLELWKG
jgi:hypothetical protein